MSAKATIPPAALIETISPAAQSYKSQSYWGIAFTSLRRDKLTIVALAFILSLGLLALLAPPLSNLLVGVGPNETNPNNALAQPYLGPYRPDLQTTAIHY